MLAICDDYANEYCISFNACKSKCLVVLPGNRRFLYDCMKERPFYVGNNPIEYVDSFAHLGHVITNLLSDNADIMKRCNDFVGQANNVLCFFNKLNSSIKCKLFLSYCMSLYGSELWLLSNDFINDLCVSWRKCARRIWGLPYNSHCFLLPLLCQCLPLTNEIHRRSLNFIKTCFSNDSPLVRAVAKYCIMYGRYNSILGHNALFCAHLYDCNIQDIIGSNVVSHINNYVHNLVEDYHLHMAHFVRELVSLREHTLELSNSVIWSRDELDKLIHDVCTC